MRFVSTRRKDPSESFSFEEAVCLGIAEDGGLFLPETLPDLSADLAAWADERPRPSYAVVVRRLLARFVSDDEVPAAELDRMVKESVAKFSDPAVVPVVRVGGVLVAELYWGPTAAFKDLAMILLARLVDFFLSRAGRRATVLVATSGDTGPAAAEACAELDSISCFVLFPRGRVSPTQARQMTTLEAANVSVYSVGGSTSDSLDDVCAAISGDLAFRRRVGLLSMNSFNLGRVLLQCAHFFSAYLAALPPPGNGAGGLPEILFSLPSGALGNAVGAAMARRMGLPARILLATNNPVIPRMLETGVFTRPAGVPMSLSPAIDIGVPYNAERLFYYAGGEDPDATRRLMEAFVRDGTARVPCVEALREVVSAVEVGREATLDAMRRAWHQHRYVACPHTAVGLAGAEAAAGESLLGLHAAARPVCVMSTAHPGKFADTVRLALGGTYPLATPPSLARAEAADPAYHAVDVDEAALEEVLRKGMVEQL